MPGDSVGKLMERVLLRNAHGGDGAVKFARMHVLGASHRTELKLPLETTETLARCSACVCMHVAQTDYLPAVISNL